ncbi:MAG: peptidoglycan-binding protein [Acidimicrobiales bacterium]
MVVLVAIVVVVVTDPFKSGHAAQSGVQDNSYPTSIATVTRQSLSSQSEVEATLGYAGSYTVIGHVQGSATALPALGQVISNGQSLYSVDGSPVVLLYGSTPAYRSLSSGTSGSDVEQLNSDLVSLGYATSAELSPTSEDFGYWTTVGVEKLQAALGVTETGTLVLGQAVFLPSALRVTTLSATLGGPISGPVLQGTSTTRQVTIALDASEQSEVKVGDHVTISLPDNQTTSGVVSSVGTVAVASPSGGSATVTVEVTPTDPAATGAFDQAPVEVLITAGTVNDALVVPINALLALATGGYAVEEVEASGAHMLVPVTTGLFDSADNLVQVTGSGLAAGQRIVVPNT